MDSSDEDSNIPTNMFVDVDQSMVVGRHGYLEIIERRLNNEKIIAISGMGGVGKTTLTCLYGYGNMQKYKDGVFFVDASNIDMLPLNFADLAGPSVMDLIPRPEQDITSSIKAASNFLERHSDYLLIYDAADDVSILEELGKQRPSGARYIPPKIKLKGHVIITSRCPKEKFDLVQILDPIHLDDLSSEDAQVFLWRRVYGDECQNLEERKQLKTLSDQYLRSHLPLFLEQTASYIRGENMTFKEYIREIQHKQKVPVGAASYGDNRFGIEERYIPTFDGIEKSCKEAGVLLNYAALCHSRDIPMFLFSTLAYTVNVHMEGSDVDENSRALADFILEKMKEEGFQVEADFDFSQINDTGENGVKKLLAFPRNTQLVNYKRGGHKFTIHAIIQDQLCVRMKETEKISTVHTLASLLLYVLSSNHIPPGTKRMILAHADSCAGHIRGMNSAKTEALVLKLRIKTAYIFATLDSKDVAWRILSDVEEKLSRLDAVDIRKELISVKAKLLIWQHKATDALRIADEGLKLFEYGNTLDMADLDATRQYALLSKSSAHALIILNEPDLNKIQKHISEAKRAFEHIIERDRHSGIVEYATLLMLHGQMHRNIAYKNQDNPDLHREELTKASKYLKEAYDLMDKSHSTTDLCRVHLNLADVKLGKISRAEAITNIGESHTDLVEKLGYNHRYSAWILEKMGQLMAEEKKHDEALDLMRKSLVILKEAYGQDGGSVQIGGTMLQEGKSLLALGRTEEALKIFLEAEKYLILTPQHGAYKELCGLLEKTHEILEYETV